MLLVFKTIEEDFPTIIQSGQKDTGYLKMSQVSPRLHCENLALDWLHRIRRKHVYFCPDESDEFCGWCNCIDFLKLRVVIENVEFLWFASVQQDARATCNCASMPPFCHVAAEANRSSMRVFVPALRMVACLEVWWMSCWHKCEPIRNVQASGICGQLNTET